MEPPIKPLKPITIDNSNKENDIPIIDSGKPPNKPPKPETMNNIITDSSIKNEHVLQYPTTPKQILNQLIATRSSPSMSPLKSDDKVYMFCFIIRTKASEAKMKVLSYLKSIYNGIISKEDDKLIFEQFLKGLNKVT